MIFRRRRSRDPDLEGEPAGVATDEQGADEQGADEQGADEQGADEPTGGDVTDGVRSAPFPGDGLDDAGAHRDGGPFDAAQDVDDAVPRLDLGGMQVPVFEGLELRVDVDEPSGQVIGATLVLDESALQVHPFAAPKTSGIWGPVREEIADSIRESGGTVEVVDGPLGPELRAEVPAEVEGSDDIVLQPVRFVGVDGPRWFLRGVFSGAAAVDPEAAAPLEAAFRAVVVVRGTEAMAPREPLPLRVPQEVLEAPLQEPEAD